MKERAELAVASPLCVCNMIKSSFSELCVSKYSVPFLFARGVHVCCVVLAALHSDQSVCLSFKVWSWSIYVTCFVEGVCVSMTVAIYSTVSSILLRTKEVKLEIKGIVKTFWGNTLVCFLADC